MVLNDSLLPLLLLCYLSNYSGCRGWGNQCATAGERTSVPFVWFVVWFTFPEGLFSSIILLLPYSSTRTYITCLNMYFLIFTHSLSHVSTCSYCFNICILSNLIIIFILFTLAMFWYALLSCSLLFKHPYALPFGMFTYVLRCTYGNVYISSVRRGGILSDHKCMFTQWHALLWVKEWWLTHVLLYRQYCTMYHSHAW